MKVIAVLIALLFTASAAAAECGEPEAKQWSTVVKLKAASVTLHWTGVYEGLATVCRVGYKTSLGETRSLEVWGQPDANEAQSLIAFLSCADDGCEKEVVVADIARGVILKTELPLSGQFYLKTKWQASDREFLVEVESSARRFLCSVGESVSCKKSGI